MCLFFGAKTRKKRHLRNGTSDHNFKILKTLFNTNYPPKSRKNHLKNNFRPLESVFLAILRKKKEFLRKYPQSRISVVRDSVYAHTVLKNDFNRVGSPFRQTWSFKICSDATFFNGSLALLILFERVGGWGGGWGERHTQANTSLYKQLDPPAHFKLTVAKVPDSLMACGNIKIP